MPSVESPAGTVSVLPVVTDALKVPPSESTPATESTVMTEEPALATETLVLNPEECLLLLVPSDGVVYPQDKEINFNWEAMPGAGKYLLEVTNSTGWLLSVEITEPRYTVSGEMFPGPLLYSWTVLAFDPAGKRICQAGPWNFSLSVKKSNPTEKPDKDQGGGEEQPEDTFPFPEW